MNRWILLLFLAGAVNATAQQDNAPPTAPFVQFPSPDVAFTVTVNGGAVAPVPAQPGQPRRDKKLVKIETVQVGKLRRDILTWDDNSLTQTWFVGPYGLVQSSYGGWINLINPARDPSFRSSMPRRDATDYFSWLAASNYAGSEGYKGRTCYHFRMGQAEDALLGNGPREAWIEARTKLPVALKLGVDMYEYKFTSAPAEPLVLPTAFKTRADRYQLLGPSPTAASH